ncbi:hypothetical protein L208DRAFT_1229601, partial [Tricholoma matsutake]
DSKYNSAFVYKLMSDDEDEFDENGKKMQHYISHPPLYHSAELIDLFETVDKAVDPKHSSCYYRHIKGPALDEPPRVSTKVQNRAIQWMVDEKWLTEEKNQQYDNENQIVISGKAWGDEEDPEEIIAKQKRVKEQKKSILEEKKCKLMEHAESIDNAKKVKGKSGRKQKGKENRAGKTS